MTIDESILTKGQLRKLNGLRKSVGDNIAEEAFAKWLAAQSKVAKEARDPIADALVSALAHQQHNKGFRLGRRGYVVRRAKGRGASGFVAYKVT
jgi:hypothetical protein